MAAACAFELLDDAARHEFWASLALRHTPGLGGRSAKRLLETFGSAYAALRHLDNWHEAEVGKDKARAVNAGTWRVTAKEEWNAARTMPGDILLWTDSRYPERLRELPDAPVLLYAQGNLDLLVAPGVAVVGMRDCSKEGLRVAGAMAAGLAASGVTVISGLALGVDGEAHTAALPLPGSTIAVLGTGIGQEYPRKHVALQRAICKQGLVLSEFSPDTPPEAKNFPIRNRIISGLALGVLVVEAALRSGSLITARLALEQNRAVYAIPGGIGQPRSEGCQELIRQGAQPVFAVSDIVRDLAPLLQSHAQTSPLAEPPPDSPAEAIPAEQPVSAEPVQAPVPLPAQAPAQTPGPMPEKKTAGGDLSARLLVALASSPMDIDSLCRELDLPPSPISRTLVQLEVMGRVRRLHDHRYSLS